MTLIHRIHEEASKLAEWFGLSEREVNWARTAKAGNDRDGYSEALLGIDKEGWFPLRIRASDYETAVISGDEASERSVPVMDEPASKIHVRGRASHVVVSDGGRSVRKQ